MAPGGKRATLPAVIAFLFRPMRVGKLFGIPFRVVPAVVLLTLLILARAAGSEEGHAGWTALLFAILGFSLVVHELAHALTARRLGLKVLDITVGPLGGMARMEGMAHRPLVEGPVALAGPAANLALAGIALILPSGGTVTAFFWVNLLLGLCNLAPAFPLDGGRILRAWLARCSPLPDATRAALAVGNAIALTTLVAGVLGGWFLLALVLTLYVGWMGRMELLQAIMLAGGMPTLAPLEVFRRAFRGPPPSESPGGVGNLERFRGSMREFFREGRDPH